MAMSTSVRCCHLLDVHGAPAFQVPQSVRGLAAVCSVDRDPAVLLELPTSWLGLHVLHRRERKRFRAETCAPSSKSATRDRDARSTLKAKHAKRRKSRAGR